MALPGYRSFDLNILSHWLSQKQANRQTNRQKKGTPKKNNECIAGSLVISHLQCFQKAKYLKSDAVCRSYVLRQSFFETALNRK